MNIQSKAIRLQPGYAQTPEDWLGATYDLDTEGVANIAYDTKVLQGDLYLVITWSTLSDDDQKRLQEAARTMQLRQELAGNMRGIR